MKSKKSIRELKKTLGSIEYIKPSVHVVGGAPWGCIEGFMNDGPEGCALGSMNSGSAGCLPGDSNTGYGGCEFGL